MNDNLSQIMLLVLLNWLRDIFCARAYCIGVGNLFPI